jgi:acylphosphatase
MNKDFELNAEINGRVQGIGFRAMIRNYADENNLFGFVMNKDSGEVRVVVQGNKEKLDRFLGWIKSNPGISRVDDIKFDVNEIKNKLKSFEIKKEYGFLEDKSRSFIKLGKSIFK